MGATTGFIASSAGNLAQQYLSGAGQASSYDYMKRMALRQGESDRNAAYAKATAEREANKRQQYQNAENLARTAGNVRRAVNDARTAEAASGVSGLQTAEWTRQAGAEAMADQARQGSEQNRDSYETQLAYQRSGDAAMRAAEALSQQYRAMAKATRAGLWGSALASAAGLAGGAFRGVSAGQAANASAEAFNTAYADAIANGTMKAQEKYSLWGTGTAGAMIGASGATGLMFSANPFLAKYMDGTNSWQNQMAWLLGSAGKNRQTYPYF